MVTLHPISLDDLRYHVQWAFEGDNELLQEYHIAAPCLLTQTVDHTMQFIRENAEFYKDDIKFFAVLRDRDCIGYTVIVNNNKVPNELYSFGINVAYRTKETLQEWLKAVEEKLGVPYYVILWSKNTRAIDFLKRNGFDVIPNKSLSDNLRTLICKL